MATAAWLHVPKNMRLTEGLVSALKEERPEYVPALLSNYREHGVVGTQVSHPIGLFRSQWLLELWDEDEDEDEYEDE
ncbi:proline-, glutamic acid- and leucine-rich protein 1, partial [Tachysurus ichikawai]